MSMLSKARTLIEKTFDIQIMRVREMPQGISLPLDIKRLLPNLEVRTVLDVGANIGQSALEFLQFYPAAQLHCFEPVQATFEALKATLRNYPNVACHRIALGSTNSEGRMVLEGASELFRLERENPGQDTTNSSHPTETVQVATLSDYCAQKGISRIQVLKIDTEGYDLEVLKGAAGMLDDMRIDLVKVEAGMNEANTRHVPFDAFVKYLAPKGYVLFGLYEQAHEWPTAKPNLRRSNPVFISRRAAGI